MRHGGCASLAGGGSHQAPTLTHTARTSVQPFVAGLAVVVVCRHPLTVRPAPSTQHRSQTSLHRPARCRLALLVERCVEEERRPDEVSLHVSSQLTGSARARRNLCPQGIVFPPPTAGGGGGGGDGRPTVTLQEVSETATRRRSPRAALGERARARRDALRSRPDLQPRRSRARAACCHFGT